MLLICVRLTTGSPVSLSPLATDSKDKKSTSPESPPLAPGLLHCFSLLNPRAKIVALPMAAMLIETWILEELLEQKDVPALMGMLLLNAQSFFQRIQPSFLLQVTEFCTKRSCGRLAHQYWYLHKGCPRDFDLTKISAEMRPSSRGIINTSSSCGEPRIWLLHSVLTSLASESSARSIKVFLYQ